MRHRAPGRKNNQSASIHKIKPSTRKEKQKMKTKIINYIRAGYPGLYLVSHEEQRVALEMTRIAQELKYNLVFWSVVDGLVDTQKGTNNSANDPVLSENSSFAVDYRESGCIVHGSCPQPRQKPWPNCSTTLILPG